MYDCHSILSFISLKVAFLKPILQEDGSGWQTAAEPSPSSRPGHPTAGGTRLHPDSNSDSDAEPVGRARRHDSDSDAAPQRRKQRHDSDSDAAPSQRQRGHESDSDAAPQRRRQQREPESDSDAEPVRRRARHDSDDEDASPPRRGRQDSDADMSPPRRCAFLSLADWLTAAIAPEGQAPVLGFG